MRLAAGLAAPDNHLEGSQSKAQRGCGMDEELYSWKGIRVRVLYAAPSQTSSTNVAHITNDRIYALYYHISSNRLFRSPVVKVSAEL